MSKKLSAWYSSTTLIHNIASDGVEKSRIAVQLLLVAPLPKTESCEDLLWNVEVKPSKDNTETDIVRQDLKYPCHSHALTQSQNLQPASALKSWKPIRRPQPLYYAVCISSRHMKPEPSINNFPDQNQEKHQEDSTALSTSTTGNPHSSLRRNQHHRIP